jgi:hypothetical protein
MAFGFPSMSLDFGKGLRMPSTLQGRKYKYQPSFGAILLNIKGKAPKGLTGLEIRPILKTKSTRRKKR